MQRREFTAGAAMAAAQGVLRGAGERARVGVIGAGGRGRYLAAEFKEIGAEVAAVCDVYEPNLKAGLKAASVGARSHADYRKLLEDKALGAVIVATPDHWHAQMTIDAVEAGKDVYVEKPLAHTIEDGFRMIEAVRRTKRIVQVGTQRRSSDLFDQARKLFRSGVTGDVRLVNAWWYNHQAGTNDKPLAGAIDWRQWLGPAAARDVDAHRFHNWYYYWDYSGGLMVGQAAHAIDAIHWFMNSSEPVAVTCAGGQANLDRVEVPETTCMNIEYPENYLAVFTVGYKAMRYNAFNDQCTQYHGAKARFDVGREWYSLWPQSNEIDMKPDVQERQPGSFGRSTRDHIRNFLECTISRKEPNAPVEAGQSTNIVLCMAMESLRRGRRMRWNSQARRMEG
jgi:predicted dehydrogenase